MYCLNCGNEVTGNFCSNCGCKLDDSTLNSNIDENLVKINNIDVDMSEVFEMFGKNQVKAIKYICDITGAELKEAKIAFDNYYNVRYPKLSFAEKRKLKKTQQATKYREIESKKRQLDKENIACCPKCGSTSLSAHKNGLDGGATLLGVFITGPSEWISPGSIKVTCLKCGHQFKAGKNR